MMKKGLAIAIASSCIALSGCSTTQPQSAFRLIPDTRTPVETAYEQIAKLNKRYEMVQQELGRIESEKQELEELLIVARNELQPYRQDTHNQVDVYQAGVKAAQTAVARRQAETTLSITELENEFDRRIAELDAALELEIAKLKQSYTQEKAKIAISHRTNVATLKTSEMMDVATVTSPVIVDGQTYDPSQKPTQAAGAAAQLPVPAAGHVPAPVASAHGGDGHFQKASLVQPPKETAKPKRVKFDAVLAFEDADTRDLWFNFLSAHQITEKFKSQNREKGEFYIYVGTYNNARQAQTRLNYVTSKIGSSTNAKLVTRTL